MGFVSCREDQQERKKRNLHTSPLNSYYQKNIIRKPSRNRSKTSSNRNRSRYKEKFRCPVCKKSFARQASMKQHMIDKRDAEHKNYLKKYT